MHPSRSKVCLLAFALCYAIACKDQRNREIANRLGAIENALKQLADQNSTLSKKVEEQAGFLVTLTNRFAHPEIKKREITGTIFYRFKSGETLKLAATEVYL